VIQSQWVSHLKSQDAFAAESSNRAAKAQTVGKFKSETKSTRPKTEKEVEIVIDSDDGIRDRVTKDGLSKLNPAFSKTGSTHTGNASQI
jgi:acetyl-CoA acyltransferase 1